MRNNKSISLESTIDLLKSAGAIKIFYKFLQENDNSKQQIYICDRPSAIEFLPRPWPLDKSDMIPKLDIDFFWVTETGAHKAPKAKLIYYPNYPEVRLSGLLQGCPGAPSHLMQPVPKIQRKQSDNRILFIGVTREGTLLGSLSSELETGDLENSTIDGKSVLKRLALSKTDRIFKSDSSNNHKKILSDETLYGAGLPLAQPRSAAITDSSTLKFRPRARIIRTIGDRLISGPDAAVIELVKNSYDADASSVYIAFLPRTAERSAQIAFEDDGHGMSFYDIENKWMEPATSDKRERNTSPNGRKLLGSKGIGRFAAARLGGKLDLYTCKLEPSGAGLFESTSILDIDWAIFDEVEYLDEISFNAQRSLGNGPAGTKLTITELRDDWTESSLRKLYQELRRLVSPLEGTENLFRISLDLSHCAIDSCGFDGRSFLGPTEKKSSQGVYEIKAFPILDACDYLVDGIFDEDGNFEGTFTNRREGSECEPLRVHVPLREDEIPCGIALIKLSIFDREASSIRSTAEKAGFGHLGVREARKLLDGIAGIAIYRDGFRIRPYGDAENDWLTLDAKRVQNPSQRIGRNQVAGLIAIESETQSNLIERSSREGLEENGSYRRLQALILALLAEEVEPRRRKYRIESGIEQRRQSGFGEALSTATLDWTQSIVERLAPQDREKAQKLIESESTKLTGYLRDLSDRQAQLEAQATLGLIIGEVMHQGNTPLTFIENEVCRLINWWPTLFNDSKTSEEDRDETPIILKGMDASAASLRELFNALNPLAGAKRGEPIAFSLSKVVQDTIFLFRSRAEDAGISFSVDEKVHSLHAEGYPEDLATALANLFDNAIFWIVSSKVEMGHISVDVPNHYKQNFVSITVSDNGPGVSSKFSDSIFAVGFSTKPNGTGLGLSIAREAIYRSGGDLQSFPQNIGTCFLLTLPASLIPPVWQNG